MDMQEYIDKYGIEDAEAKLQHFQRPVMEGGFMGMALGMFPTGSDTFLSCVPPGKVRVYCGKSWINKRATLLWGACYTVASDYSLPYTPEDTPDKPVYFVGELKPLGLYSTPTAVDDWENETHDDILVSEYKEWAFLGFSWEDPRTEEDWNAEHFAHLTPFAKGDDDEVVVAPYAVWRKKGE